MSNERRHPGREPWRERFDDLKEAYALGTLTEDECREFEDYLAAHPELQAEVDDLGAIANLLAFAPQEHEPPPELRRELLSRIGGATLAEGPTRRARLRRLFGPGGLVAAAMAVVAIPAVVGLFAWNENLRGELQARQTYELRGSGAAQNVRGQVVDMGDSHAVLVAENMPPAPEGETYEAWLMRDEVPEPAGLFQPRDGVAATPIGGSLESVDAVAVTVEPSGGSSTPTSDMLLTAEI